jgi:hypothetical protein
VTPANWNGYQPVPPKHPGVGRQIAWALAGCAAVHSAVLFRPGRGQPVPIPSGPAGLAERTRLRDLMLFA